MKVVPIFIIFNNKLILIFEKMKWFLILLKFLSGSVSFFGILFFVIVCISGVVNPVIQTKNGETQNSTFKAAVIIAMVSAIFLTLFLIIP